MKVKFYKGPYHGKTKDVAMRDPLDPILVNAWGPRYSFIGDNNTFFRIKTAVYKPRMMSLTSGYKVYNAPAMHPDGSVFYVFERYEESINGI